MPDSETNPLQQVYDKLWTLLESHSFFTELIDKGNRVKFDKESSVQVEISSDDTPEVMIGTTTLDLQYDRTSNSSFLTKRYDILVSSGDKRLQEGLYQVEWEIIRGFSRWRGQLDGLSWAGIPFVIDVRLISGTEGISIPEQNRGIAGWSSILSLEVDMIFNTASLHPFVLPTDNSSCKLWLRHDLGVLNALGKEVAIGSDIVTSVDRVAGYIFKLGTAPIRRADGVEFDESVPEFIINEFSDSPGGFDAKTLLGLKGSAMFAFEGTSIPRKTLFCMRDSADADEYIYFRLNTSREMELEVSQGVGPTITGASGDTVLTDDIVWVVTFTSSSTGYKFYVDLQTEETLTPIGAGADGDWFGDPDTADRTEIGRGPTGREEPWNGKLKEIALFTDDLGADSTERIAQINGMMARNPKA